MRLVDPSASSRRVSTWASLLLICISCDVDEGRPRIADATIGNRFEPGEEVELASGPGVVGTKHKLTVAVLTLRGEHRRLSEIEVTDLFEDARGLAVDWNGPRDVNCCLDLAVSGEPLFVEVVEEALVRPETQVEMDALRDKNFGTVVIVDELRWCGDEEEEEDPNDPVRRPPYYGCSNFERQVIELRYDSADRSFLHEVGHLRGLNHRSKDDPLCEDLPEGDESRLPRAVMCPSFAGGRLSQDECDAMTGREWMSLPGTEAGAIACEYFPSDP